MSEWALRTSDSVSDGFFIEGPFSGPDIQVLFGDRFPGDSSAIVFPHQGDPYPITWHDVQHITLHLHDRLKLPGNPTSCGPLEHVMQRLLDPQGGCLWDQSQTSLSLLRYLLDESYEAAEALVAGDRQAFYDELGDVLFQVVFHSALASPEVFDHVVQTQVAKLVRRHPHVFAKDPAKSVEAINDRWERLKALEPSRPHDAEWTFPGLVWAKRLSKRGLKPQTRVFQAVSELLKVYISNQEGTLEEILADAAWAVADVARQHQQDAEWALWKRLAFASQERDSHPVTDQEKP
ncbi:MAG: nucleotide pyrophosphohydrolase [Sulfobacillus thermosulfidooxidans]|uniref:NTP pyrophosphohydrolase MazG-like domain-containing protein n=1 Tax=Sulfobacillus thermotolerans TaxID=338644 RepID=A0ABN5GWJ8_9FIRM|nr:MazG nucleotide pyrophosphohydrolase domain-containing protein [Sulfobacillus sp. hq2]AUW92803.1 hypothetical protein BXT84_01565 [Sulfobacillus thermotolerans]POB09950.1 nucleotide pyrophosphohydrolase [Sulfobacillus sp. hq2]PSR37658.1 MAG: nucleotide pyrophosphohydrolase [Sulfobacillus thermosulfidooxidans]